MPLRSVHRSRLAIPLIARLGLPALALAAVLAAPADAAPNPKAKTHPATCDEVPGVNQAVNDRWRLFNPVDSDSEFQTEPDLWACRRSSRPVKRVLPLPLAVSAGNLVGDVVEADGSGRYNAFGQLVDLAHRRVIQRYDDLSGGNLLETGAVVLRPTRTASGTIPAAPLDPDAGPAPYPGGLTAFDGAGPHPFEAGPTWTPQGGTTAFRLGSYPGAALPFASGFYYAAPDGALRRFATTGAASTAAWPRTSRLKWKRYRARVTRPKGVKVSSVGFRELHTRAMTGGRAAALTLHTPSHDSLEGSSRKSDLIARLVPGSEAELRLIGRLVLGRFTDAPGELRLRLPDAYRPGKFSFDLAVPSGLDRSLTTNPYGDFVFFDGDDLLVLEHDEGTETYTQRRLPAPVGAHDLAVVPGNTNVPTGWLLYTGADGQPAALRYREPATG